MRKSVTKIVKATVAAAMMIGAGVGVAVSSPKASRVVATESVFYTLNGTDTTQGTNGYATESDVTQSGISWKVTANTTINPWRIGGKQITGVDRPIYSIDPISDTVTKVVVDTGTSTLDSVNSTKLIVASNSNFSTIIEEVSSAWVASSTITYQTQAAKSWTNAYYKFVFNVTKTANSNAYCQFIDAKFYRENSGGDPEPTGYTVSFNSNGGTGTMLDIPNVEGTYSLPASTFTAPSGKVFVGWKAENAGDLLVASAEYEVTEDVTFYAQWEDRYTVKYYSNGGTGTLNDSTKYAPSATVTVKANTFTAPFADMVFDKWNTAADGSGTYYNPNDTFNISANTSLYAQWVDDPSIPYTNVYSTGFDSSDGFTSTNVYNSEKDDGPNNKQWHIYYGTASTGTPISGNQSLQMRWYGNDVENLPHAETKFPSNEVKRITFKYKVGNNNLDFKVQYNTDGGDSWNDIETVNTSNGNVNTYRKIFDSPIASAYFRVLGVAGGTAPTSGNNYQFRIDDFSVDTIATPATINGNSSVQVGTQWSPANITENAGEHNVVTGVTYSFTPSNGAVISDSNTSTGSFTCSAVGTVTVNAVKSGYIITGKTVAIQPADPFVNNLSKTSTNGFTGQNETITFSYGNLNSALNVVSGDEEIVTVEAPVYNAGSGSVQLNFVGAGTTTIAFKDGSTSIDGASISVTVATSAVSITGMPASRLMGNGTSLNLGAYITVSASGICSDDVSWTSSVPEVATVNDSGVVAAVSVGTAVITVTPDDYPAGAVSCNLTVANEKAILATSITTGDTVFLGSQAVSMQYNGPSTTSTVFGLGVDFIGAPNVGGIALEVENGKAANSYAFKIKSGDYADKYLTWVENNSLDVADSIDDNSSWNVAIDGDGNASITNVKTSARKIWWNVDSPRFAAYTDKSNGDHYKYVQLWKQVNPESYYNPANTVNTIHGRENYTAEVLTSVDSVVIRFGATIAKSNWDAIKSNWEITDYGVMLMRKTDLDGNAYLSVEEAFEDNASSSILKIINKRAGGAAYADPYLDGDDYLFTVRVNFQDDAQYYDDVIYAVPFVVAGGQYYFFNEMHTSVQELALDYYNTGYTYLSDEALEILIGD